MQPVCFHAEMARDTSLNRQETTSLEQTYGLMVPIPRTAGLAILVAGSLSAITGLAVWAAASSGSWVHLAGSIAVDLGGTLLLLGSQVRPPAGRLPLNPLTGFLAVTAFRRLLGLIYVLGQRDALSSPFTIVPTAGFISASAKAELVTLLGTIGFFLGWQLLKGRQNDTHLAIATGKWQARKLWLAYLIGAGIFVASWVAPGIVGRGGALLSISGDLAFGAIFALLVFNRRFGVASSRRWWAVAAVAPLFAPAMTWGMKSGFVIPLLPLAAAYLIRKPTRAFALTVVGIGGLLLFVFPYVKEYREANWNDSAVGTSAGEVARNVGRSLKREGAASVLATSFQEFQERFGSVGEAGAVVFFSDTTGHMGAFFLRTLPWAFIPRFLWPDKPSWDPSAWFTAYLSGRAIGEADVRTATALHIATELYWMMGLPAAFVGLFAAGFYFRWVHTHLLSRGAHRPVFLAAWYGFLVWTAFSEEVRFVSALVSPAIVLVNAYLVSIVVELVLTQRLTRRTRRSIHQRETLGRSFQSPSGVSMAPQPSRR